MNIRAVGYKPVDEKWTKMRAAREACIDAGVPVPDAVAAFFENKDPDPAGVRIELPLRSMLGHGVTKPWSDRKERLGVELDLVQLRAEHPDIKVLRIEVEAPDEVKKLLDAEAAAKAEADKPAAPAPVDAAPAGDTPPDVRPTKGKKP